MTDPCTAESGIMGALPEAHPGPLSRVEIASMLGDRLVAADAVGALQRDGVANVEGSLVFASRAAVRADQRSI
jgi:hypothetical protein